VSRNRRCGSARNRRSRRGTEDAPPLLDGRPPTTLVTTCEHALARQSAEDTPRAQVSRRRLRVRS
jgi:hypothetical protein